MEIKEIKEEKEGMYDEKKSTPDHTTQDEKITNFSDELDDSLDLDSFGKMKKKKKKQFNLDDIENALPKVTKKEATSVLGIYNIDAKKVADEEENDDIDLDMDFTTSKKKRKSKKKDLNELFVCEKENHVEEKENDTSVEEPSWLSSGVDYQYDYLLSRAFGIMLEKNPEMVTGTKPKFVMRLPQVLRVGSKKTSFANFMDIAKTLHRQPKHLLDFLLAELGTSGSMDGNNQLIIKGRFQQKQIENVLRRYIKEYVTCHTCHSPETILQKDNCLLFLQCESCGSRCSVARIKSGFRAVTGRRAAMRAKTT